MRLFLHLRGVVFFLLILISIKGQAANGTNYDIIYHRIELTVDPGTSAKIISGKVTTYFKTTVANVSSLEFDLDGAMTVSSATYHGTVISKSHNTTTDILTLTFPTIATKGTLDSVTITYSGTPIIAVMSGVPSGFNYQTHGSGKTSGKAIFTLDEPYTAHNWWPCKESLNDKIDEVQLIVTTPNTYKVAGNGSLIYEVASGSNTVTMWKTQYPIATYAINFAVANYQNYQYNITINGKDVPVLNYFYSEDLTTTFKTKADELKKILPMYSTLFGVDYPYMDEKYGLAECTAGWGALEVPTMTFVASDAYDKYTLAHEAAHQWFGDMVTTSDWHHIWLNEGFAKYCEAVLFPENLYPAELATQRLNLKNSVAGSLTTYVSDISTPNNIFIGSTSEPYEKGAMFLSMLRTWVGDADFFAALKSYLTAPGISYGFTTMDLLKQYMQPKTKIDLTEFFNDWIFQKGRVQYQVNYQTATNGIYIQLQQSPTSAGAGYFDTPVPIRIQGTGLDTTVVIIDKGGTLYSSTGNSYGSNKTIFYKLSKTPTSISFDPDNLVLATATTTTAVTNLGGVTMTVLPVKELNLSVSTNDGKANINWSVNSDDSLASIIIERSKDALNFVPVQTNAPYSYETNLYKGIYVDNDVNETQYYRLKVVKKDGSYSYSKVEKVTLNYTGKMLVAPNPVRDLLQVFIPAGLDNDVFELVIRDIAGQTVSREEIIVKNNNKVNVSTQNIKPGIYWAVLMGRRTQYYQAKFIKQ